MSTGVSLGYGQTGQAGPPRELLGTAGWIRLLVKSWITLRVLVVSAWNFQQILGLAEIFPEIYILCVYKSWQ